MRERVGAWVPAQHGTLGARTQRLPRPCAFEPPHSPLRRIRKTPSEIRANAADSKKTADRIPQTTLPALVAAARSGAMTNGTRFDGANAWGMPVRLDKRGPREELL